MTKWLTEQEQQVWRQWLSTIQHQINAIDDDLQTNADLAMSDYEILVTLSESPGGQARMSDLADRAVISRSRLTYRVNRLVERGFVFRCEADSDGRGVMAQLTDEGMAYLVKVAPSHVETVQGLVFERLDARDLDDLGRILGKLTDPPLD